MAFQGETNRATDIGKRVPRVGPTLGITFSSPARRALATTNLTPSRDRPMPASSPTQQELISTPPIQLLKASPQSSRALRKRRR